MSPKKISNIYNNYLLSSVKISDINNIKRNSTLNLQELVPDLLLKKIDFLIQGFFTKDMSSALPGNWSTRCIDISANIYAFLRRCGIPCEIVYGDIEIKGVRKYNTDIDSLMEEHKEMKQEGAQIIHAWITLGDDVIIDGGLYDMTISQLDWKEKWNNRIIVTRASELSLTNQIDYIPMFVGAGFLSTTNVFKPSMFFDNYDLL